MKSNKTIVVLNYGTGQVELVPCPKDVKADGVDAYLKKCGYDTGRCTWMLVDGEVKATYHGSGDYAVLGDLSVCSQRGNIKNVECERLVKRLNELGVEKYEFGEDDRPVVVAYVDDEPAYFAVDSLKAHHWGIFLYGYDKRVSKPELTVISADDVFPGHLQYVTDNLK